MASVMGAGDAGFGQSLEKRDRGKKEWLLLGSSLSRGCRCSTRASLSAKRGAGRGQYAETNGSASSSQPVRRGSGHRHAPRARRVGHSRCSAPLVRLRVAAWAAAARVPFLVLPERLQQGILDYARGQGGGDVSQEGGCRQQGGEEGQALLRPGGHWNRQGWPRPACSAQLAASRRAPHGHACSAARPAPASART